jgi:hypothetical protein
MISAMVIIRALLPEHATAAEAGLVDDISFLDNGELDRAFAQQEAARNLYIQHRSERHGPAARYIQRFIS